MEKAQYVVVEVISFYRVTMPYCNVCYNKATIVVPTSNCKHGPSTCAHCISTSLSINLNGGSLAICSDITKIPCCGASSCKSHFEETDLKKYLAKNQMKKWYDLAFQVFAKQQPDFRWCSKPSCGSGQIVDGGEESNSFFRCYKCSTLTCVRHRIKMHIGITCSEYDMTGTDHSLSMDEISKSSKPCPRCGEAVNKSDGCDHMTCLCGYEFCYGCLADWKKIINRDNSFHNPGCEWYFSGAE